jgi:hypothetical protein
MLKPVFVDITTQSVVVAIIIDVFDNCDKFGSCVAGTADSDVKVF